jgi:hypothetical protein
VKGVVVLWYTGTEILRSLHNAPSQRLRLGLGGRCWAPELCHARMLESSAMARWSKKSNAPAPAPITFVRIRITNRPGKYAVRGVKGDILVAPKAQASEFPSTEAPRRQKELERRGFKTKVEPA